MSSPVGVVEMTFRLERNMVVYCNPSFGNEIASNMDADIIQNLIKVVSTFSLSLIKVFVLGNFVWVPINWFS